MRFVFVECSGEGCALRFPLNERDPQLDRCPRCGSPLREVAGGQAAGEQPAGRIILPFEVIVDNVRSAHNVGSILRSADAAGARRVLLCGITPTPDHPRVLRSSLGAEASIAWAYAPNALAAASELRSRAVALWALEERPDAPTVFDAPLPPGPLALIVGNELAGVDPALLALADAVVCLPMRGLKRSLNAAVAFGAAALILAERLSVIPAPASEP